MNLVETQVATQQRCAMIALHDVNLAARYCNHMLMLFGDGGWRAGPVDELLNRENLEKLYQCPVESIQTLTGTRFLPGV